MKVLKKILSFLLLMILIVIATVGLFILIQFIQEKIFAPKEYLLWIFKGPYNRLVLLFEFYILGFAMIKIRNKKYDDSIEGINKWFKKIVKKYKKIFIAVNIFIIYVIMINVTVITSDKIIDYSVLRPLGKDYSYEDVAKIKTGVYGLRIPFVRDKGEFYYIIELNDWRRINLNDTLGGTGKELDTYEEIEIFDKDLSELGVEKESSLDNIEECNLDKVYVERFERIINNK